SGRHSSSDVARAVGIPTISEVSLNECHLESRGVRPGRYHPEGPDLPRWGTRVGDLPWAAAMWFTTPQAVVGHQLMFRPTHGSDLDRTSARHSQIPSRGRRANPQAPVRDTLSSRCRTEPVPSAALYALLREKMDDLSSMLQHDPQPRFASLA